MSGHCDLVVTGGLGLIGSALVEAWPGRSMIVDDERGSVVPLPGLTCSLEPLHVRSSVERMAELSPGGARGARAVVHCAAPVGPVGILAGNTLTDLIDSTAAAITIARTSEVPLIVLSSSEVYGTPRPAGYRLIPDEGWAPRWEYAAGKIAVELMAGRHHHETGLPTAIVRPWNTVGPLQSADKGFVFPRWADAVLTGQPITVYGDGLVERAFLWVHDLAALLVQLIEGQRAPGGAWSCTPMDAANPRNRVSMRELAGMFYTGLRRPPIDVGVDPAELHGPTFREAGAGSKLPPNSVALQGWTALEEMVSLMLTARGATLRA